MHQVKDFDTLSSFELSCRPRGLRCIFADSEKGLLKIKVQLFGELQADVSSHNFSE